MGSVGRPAFSGFKFNLTSNFNHEKTEVKYQWKITVARVFSCNKSVHLCSFILCIISCDEQRIIEPFVPEGDRIVLLEEITRKGCSVLKEAGKLITFLPLPENLVWFLSMQVFANHRFSVGSIWLRTTEGEFLYTYLGPNAGYLRNYLSTGLRSTMKCNSAPMHGHPLSPVKFKSTCC